MKLALCFVFLVLVAVCSTAVEASLDARDENSQRTSESSGRLEWKLRDHEANHTGNSTDPDHDHDHDHDHEHHYEEEALHEIFAMFDADNDTRLSEEELELLHSTMFPLMEHEHDHDHDHDHGNGTEPDHDHDHDHDHEEAASNEEEDHDHAHNKRQRISAMNKRKTAMKTGSLQLSASAPVNKLASRMVRREAEGQAASADAWMAVKRELTEEEFELYCLTPETLFGRYDADLDGYLNETEFVTMTPQLVLMVVKGCNDAHEHDDGECKPPEAWESWLAGLGSVAIICLVSLIGIFLIPFTVNKKHKIMSQIHELAIMLMISFAVGALIGDAVLHLMPEVLEVHSHSGGGHEHEHEAEEEDHDDKSYLEPLALVLVGVFFFFFIEKVLLLILGKEIQHGHGLQHGHQSSDDEMEMEEGASKPEDKGDSVEPTDEEFRHNAAGLRGRIRRFGSNQVQLMKTVKTYGWLNLISDVFHNFVDGLAIGSAYSQSLSMGLSTTLAVGFHEIPQELGDYGVLIKAGFTKAWALTFNFVTACSAFLGVIIGLGVGSEVSSANKWILGFTAGGFFYIALADLLPELNAHPRKGWLGLLDVGIQFFGVLLGFGIMAIIAVTEDEHEC